MQQKEGVKMADIIAAALSGRGSLLAQPYVAGFLHVLSHKH